MLARLRKLHPAGAAARPGADGNGKTDRRQTGRRLGGGDAKRPGEVEGKPGRYADHDGCACGVYQAHEVERAISTQSARQDRQVRRITCVSIPAAQARWKRPPQAGDHGDAKDSRRAHHAFKVDPEKYEDAKAFLASKGIEVFEEEDRKKGVFVGRQFYIRDPDGTVIEFTEWDGTSRLD